MALNTQPSSSPPPAWLVQTIEAQIIPRLLIQAVNSRGQAAPAIESWHPTADDVAEFTHLLVTHTPAVAWAYLDLWRERGTTLQDVYLELLAPTPAHLARMRETRELGLASFLRARFRLLRLVQQLRRHQNRLAVAATNPS
jgi:hypothetical protein